MGPDHMLFLVDSYFPELEMSERLFSSIYHLFSPKSMEFALKHEFFSPGYDLI